MSSHLCNFSTNYIWSRGKGLTNCIRMSEQLGSKCINAESSKHDKLKNRIYFHSLVIYYDFPILPLIKVGPRFSIVSFSTRPYLYWEMLWSSSLSPLEVYLSLMDEVRILIAAAVKEETTFTLQK